MKKVCLAAIAFPFIALAASSAEEFEKARQLLASGHAAEAAAIYRQLAQADSGNPDLRLNLAIALYKAGDFRGAAQSAADALQRNPGMLPAHLFLGASELELSDYGKAIPELQQVIAANPEERNARLMLGRALLATHQPAAAEEQFLGAARLMPESAAAWYGLGRSREALGHANAASEAWERLSALPPSVESHMHAAEMHVTAQRWQAAADEWKQTLQLRPTDQPAVLGLGEALYRSRDYLGAMAQLKPLVSAGVPAALFLYGGSLMNLQRPADAIPYLHSALAQDPNLLPASAALGQALLQTDKAAEAIPLLQAALPADRDGSTHFQLFRAYQLTNRKQEAREMLSEYQRLRSSLEEAR